MIPTGNPNIPPYVREAKEIKDVIIEKGKGVTFLEEELFSPDDVEEEEDIKANQEDDVKRDGEAGQLKIVSLHSYILNHIWSLTCYAICS